MKLLLNLSLLLLFAMLAPKALAQEVKDETKDGEEEVVEHRFQHKAEFRVRYQWDQNATGVEDDQPISQDGFTHRFKFGTTFKANEKLSATLTLIHWANWGSNDLGTSSTGTGHSPSGDSLGVLSGTQDSENMILVNEAYGVWSLSDSFVLKFGRGNLTIGDGNWMGANDWQNVPFSFEGANLAYLTEAVDFSVFGIRYAEWDRYNRTTSTENDNFGDDPESNAYGVSINIKSLPDVFNLVNIHAQQSRSAEVYCQQASGSCTSTDQSYLPNVTNLRFGTAIAGDIGFLDFQANYEGEQGQTRKGGTANGSIDSMMYQLELGVSFPEYMNFRFYALYHQDTGDDNGVVESDATATVDDDNISRQRYDGFFYERHRNAGLMDILQWGNLTYISSGFTMEPMSDLFLGVHYHLFSRTVDTDSVQFQGANTGFNGLGNGALLSENYSESLDVDDELDIGQELDLVATQKYEGGLELTATAGMFMPGSHLKNANANEIDQTYYQALVEAKMSF